MKPFSMVALAVPTELSVGVQPLAEVPPVQ